MLWKHPEHFKDLNEEIKNEIKDNKINISKYIEHPEQLHNESQVIIILLKRLLTSLSNTGPSALSRDPDYEAIANFLAFEGEFESNIFATYSILKNLEIINEIFDLEKDPQRFNIFRLIYNSIYKFKDHDQLHYINNKYVSVYKWYLKALSSTYIENKLFEIYVSNDKKGYKAENKKKFMKLIKLLNNGDLTNKLIQKDIEEGKK